MMKSKKIKLEDLKVRSFVTMIKKNQNVTIRGGAEVEDTEIPGCKPFDSNGTDCAVNQETRVDYCTQI